jgi:hypothetical protein
MYVRERFLGNFSGKHSRTYMGTGDEPLSIDLKFRETMRQISLRRQGSVCNFIGSLGRLSGQTEYYLILAIRSKGMAAGGL